MVSPPHRESSRRREPEAETGHLREKKTTVFAGTIRPSGKGTMTMLTEERFGKATFTRRDALKLAGPRG